MEPFQMLIKQMLLGHARGCALGLLGCEAEPSALFPEGEPPVPVGRVQLLEPCRMEHPHSAFVRKAFEHEGKPALRTTLYAPDGRLTEERLKDGAVLARRTMDGFTPVFTRESYIETVRRQG